MDRTSDETTDVPAVVCTLEAGSRADQKLEWSDLGAHALSKERIEGGVLSTYPIGLAAQIEDLANREMACCGTWLATKTARVGDVIRVELTTTNPEGLGLILSIAGLEG